MALASSVQFMLPLCSPSDILQNTEARKPEKISENRLKICTFFVVGLRVTMEPVITRALGTDL